MRARDGCAGGDGRSCVHSTVAQRCPCGISAITYTACSCCLFEQSVYAPSCLRTLELLLAEEEVP
eukprot:7987432-Prorocentrum_lima.AAC.1